MNQNQYCQERKPQEGSSAHYAIRMARDAAQSLTLYVLCRELFSIADITDDNVAHTKLAWWRQELASLEAASAAPTHPLSQALLRHGFAKPAALHRLSMLADSVDIQLTQARFLDEAARTNFLNLAAAAPAAALAEASGADDDAVRHAGELGFIIGRARLLMDVGKDARQQRIYLPHTLLKRFNVPAADILKGRATPALKSLACHEAMSIEADASRVLKQMSSREIKQCRSLRVYAALTFARLGEVARDDYQVAAHRLSLTPIRKLAIAWRTTYLPS